LHFQLGDKSVLTQGSARFARGFVAAFLFSGATLLAQETTATLVGNVTDPSGAAIAGVVIRATNSANNTTREAKTDNGGSYTLPFIPAGEYSITASAGGFQTQKVERIVLQVQQSARVDFKMTVGNVNESIDVAASAAALQTENATVGTVIDSAKILELPLNGRNFIQLAQLIPGVQPGTPGSITVRRGRGSVGQSDPSFGATAASANGMRDTADRFLLDGIETMDYDAVTYSFSPSVDSLAEFKVETNSYSAESGGAPGAQVNMVTKSGTNRLHGTLWEFNRNNDFSQSYNAIGNVSLTPPRLNRNQFGANIGGPVYIPKLYRGKDKTFFFFNWEKGYAAQGSTPSYVIVPPTAVRTGDFSQVTNARTGAPIPIKDPFSGSPFPGNIVPASRLSFQSLTFLQYVAQPNTQNGALNYLSAPFSAVSTQNNYTTRIDHNISSHDLLSGTYLYNNTYEAGVPYWGHDERNNFGTTQNVSGSEIHTFKPTLINEFRAGWHTFYESEIFGTTNDPNYDVVGKMQLPLVSRLPEEYGPPTISISGPDGAFSVYNLQRQIGPRVRSNSIYQGIDTLSWQVGKQFIRMGTEVDKRFVTFGQARAPRGSFTFDGTYTGSALADFMLGYIKSDNVNPTHTNTDLSDFTIAFFINDDIKLTPRLTVNVGLRWDYFAPYVQSDNRFVDIFQNGFQLAGVQTVATSPYRRGLIQPNSKDFGPRFGFAYRPRLFGEGVIRGGYGIYYTPEISNAIFAMAEGAQATAGATITGNLTGQPNIFFNDPFALASTANTLPFAVSNDQNMKDSYIQQWNVTLQHKLPASIVIDVAYVGTKGTRLIVTYPDLNMPLVLVDPRTPGLPSLNARRPNQQFLRAVTGDKSVGNSIYHALQVKGERRLASGLTFLTSYTWSKSISGPSDIGGQVGGGFYIGTPQNPYYAQGDRSVSGFDLTQRFVATVLYDIPFFHNTHGFVKALADGWQVSTIATAQSGFPTPVSSNLDTTGTGITSRPNILPGMKGDLPSDKRSYQQWFNTAAFTQATYGSFGTSPRTDAFRLPGLVNFDFSATKAFRFKETRNFQFRAEMFNLFNHYNPDPQTVDTNINSATFGKIGGGVLGVTTRVIQLGAKLNF
jgi:Carboxypeptidase regulatory-like domain